MTEEAGQFAVRVPIAKLDDERRRVYGYALTAADATGKLVEDHQGDVIEVADLEAAASQYMRQSRDLGEMHERGGLGELTDSVVLSPDVRRAMGVEPGPAAWFVGYEVRDDNAWAKVKSGELAEFSIEGDAYRIPVAKAKRLHKLEIRKVDLVDRGAALGARVTLYKRRPEWVEKGSPMDLAAVMAKLSEEERKVVEAAIAAGSNKEAPKGEDPKEEMMKRLPEEIRKQLDAERAAMKAEAEKAEAERQAVAKRLADLEEANLDREMVAKARANSKGAVGLSEQELAAVFKSLHKGQPLAKDVAAKLEQHFTSAAELVAKSALLQETGTAGAVAPDSAKGKLEAIAKSLRAADPKLTEVAAFDKAAQENPSLFAEARKEERAR